MASGSGGQALRRGTNLEQVHGGWTSPAAEPTDRQQEAARASRRGELDREFARGAGLSSDGTLAEAAQTISELDARLETPPAGLTAREVEVLTLLAEGVSNDELAARLVLSPRTVHAHLRSIFGKLGVSSRTAAVHEAARLRVRL